LLGTTPAVQTSKRAKIETSENRKTIDPLF
jgi:hypothetical protein